VNDRVQQLAERAGIEWDDKYHYFVSAATMRLFAQSVAYECAEIALREEHDSYECILKEFGLETAGSTLRNRFTGNDLVYRLRKRAEIRRQIPGRKSVEEGTPDRIADLLEEAANRIDQLEKQNG